MDPKLKDVLASVLAAAGAVMVYMGWTDDMTWAQWSGVIMSGIALVMPFWPKAA